MPLDAHENIDDLVRRSCQGDKNASQDLVEHYYGQVITIVHKHCPRSSEPEDLAQEVFLKMFARIDQFRGEQPFGHWLARIAVNTCFDQLRRQKARPLFTYTDLNIHEAEAVERFLSEETEPGAGIDGTVVSDLVNRLIATLKPAEQIAVRLLDIEEHSVNEACELTGWGASKVKVTAMRGRRKLRNKLQHLKQEIL